jgi:hypothetical protein
VLHEVEIPTINHGSFNHFLTGELTEGWLRIHRFGGHDAEGAEVQCQGLERRERWSRITGREERRGVMVRNEEGGGVPDAVGAQTTYSDARYRYYESLIMDTAG